MAINFPTSPSTNDTFTAGSISYKWDGTKWIGLGVTPTDRLIEGSNSLEITAGNELIWTGGKVGVNQVTPIAIFHAKSGANDGSLVSTFEGATNNKLNIRFDTFGPVLDVTAGDPLIFEIGGNEKLRITSTGATVTGSFDLPNVNSYITGNGHNVLQVDATRTYFYGGTNGVQLRKADNSSEIVTVDNDGNSVFFGTISDSKGDLRKIIFKQEGSAYTLVAADAGKAIEIATGGITVPNGVFGSGDAITIINDSGSSQSITMGTGLGNMFNVGDGTSGNLTLAGRGMATIYFVNGTTCYISGGGLS